MTPVTLTEALQMSAEWSWLFVAWLFPLGPLGFAAWWLVSAVRFEVRRRAAAMPALGYRAASGAIVRDRSQKVPAVEATFELEAKKLKGGTGYRLRRHTISARTFTLETDTGEHLEVRPDNDAVALHAPLEGTSTSRSSRVVAGDRVWVYGPAEAIRSKVQGRDVEPPAQSGSNPAGVRTELLVSTVPIAEVFRSERNRRLGLAMAAAVFLVASELAVFGGYWDVIRVGQPMVGHVVDKSMRFERERPRFGRSFLTTDHVVTVEVEGRRAEFDVSEKSWQSVTIESPVALLSSPAAVMFGPAPYITTGRCFVMTPLMFFGLTGLLMAGLFQRPWYSVKRGWRGVDRTPKVNR